HGKYFWWTLDRRPWPVFHFGLSGMISIRGEPSVVLESARGAEALPWPPKHLKLVVRTKGGVELGLRDPRRMSRVWLTDDPKADPRLTILGPDTLDAPPSPKAIALRIGHRKAPLKTLLLDQALFAGIGNWVADEVLLAAKLHPNRSGASLSAAEQR